MAPSGSSVPSPDPTERTQDELRRELASLREIIEARLDGIDKATELRLKVIDHLPTTIAVQVAHEREIEQIKFDAVRELQQVKFDGVKLQFLERDVRTDQAARSSKEALDAALLAAKELVGAQNTANAAAAAKSEDNFTKQIDQIGTLITTTAGATDARITEIKERLDRGAGGIEGAVQTTNTKRADTSQNLAYLLALVAVISLVVSVYLGTKK